MKGCKKKNIETFSQQDNADKDEKIYEFAFYNFYVFFSFFFFIHKHTVVHSTRLKMFFRLGYRKLMDDDGGQIVLRFFHIITLFAFKFSDHLMSTLSLCNKLYFFFFFVPSLTCFSLPILSAECGFSSTFFFYFYF